MADPTTNKPTHEVCFIKDRGEGKKGYWTSVGAAWTHKDSGGLFVPLDLVPTDLHAGRIVVCVRTEKPADGRPLDRVCWS